MPQYPTQTRLIVGSDPRPTLEDAYAKRFQEAAGSLKLDDELRTRLLTLVKFFDRLIQQIQLHRHGHVLQKRQLLLQCFQTNGFKTAT